MTQPDVAAQLMLDTKLSSDARVLGWHLLQKGPGVHEVGRDEWAAVLGPHAGRDRVRNALHELDLRDWIRRAPGGRGHFDDFEFTGRDNRPLSDTGRENRPLMDDRGRENQPLSQPHTRGDGAVEPTEEQMVAATTGSLAPGAHTQAEPAAEDFAGTASVVRLPVARLAQAAPEVVAREAVIQANKGMSDNPEIGSRLMPLYSGDAVAQQTVLDWLEAGISPTAIYRGVYRAARTWKPRGRSRQITSMAYFDGAVHDEHQRLQATEAEAAGGDGEGGTYGGRTHGQAGGEAGRPRATGTDGAGASAESRARRSNFRIE